MQVPEDIWFCQWLKDNDPNYSLVVPIGNGRWAGIFQFMFTGAIIVGQIGDKNCYDDRWCYHDTSAARKGLENWIEQRCEGEPQGWHRHPLSGRRRPDGDADQEYVAR